MHFSPVETATRKEGKTNSSNGHCRDMAARNLLPFERAKEWLLEEDQ